jgi:predicted  nucleic acid-binding Zn-ribbon protein
VGYRSLWNKAEDNVRYPVFFTTPDLIGSAAAVPMNYVLFDLRSGEVRLPRGVELKPDNYDRSIAQAMASGDARSVRDMLAQEIRRSPLRQKMENDRNLFMERQKQYKQIEEQVAVLADRKDAIRDAIARAEEQLNALQARYESNPPADLEAVRAFIAEVSKCRETIVSYEQEMKRLTQEATTNDQRGTTIRGEAARLRSEFEQLKAQYDKEMPAKKAAMEAQRAAADEMAKTIDETLMAHYKRIKKHITPPLSRLINGQCSGCNTSLPSAVLHRVRNASEEIVECESCGRMIINK